MRILCGRRWGVARGVWLVWKLGFIKNDVAGNDDTACAKVVAPVPFVFERIAEENTARRTGRELVIHGGMEVWETKTTEHAEMSVVGQNAVEEEVGCVWGYSTRGASIE